MRRAVLPTTLVTIALVLAGCSGGSSDSTDDTKPALPQPEARQCVAEEMPDENDTAPDFSTIVPCTEPHIFEIIAVTPVPKKFQSGRTKAEKLARRAELATVGDKKPKVAEQLQEVVGPICGTAISAAAGLGQVDIAGKPAAEVGLRIPRSGASTWLSISPPDLWSAGKTYSICSIRYAAKVGSDQAKPVRSPDSAQLITRMLDQSRDFPLSLFDCATGKGKAISCTKPHGAERFVTYDAKLAFGKGFARGTDVNALPTAEAKKIIEGCKDVMRGMDGEGIVDRHDVYATASKSIDTDGPTLPVECVIAPLDGGPQTMRPGYLFN